VPVTSDTETSSFRGSGDTDIPCFPTPIIIRPTVKIFTTVVTSLQRLVVSSTVKTETMTTPVPLTTNRLVSSSYAWPKLSGDRRASIVSITPVIESTTLLQTHRFLWFTPRRRPTLTLPNWSGPQTNSSLRLPLGHLSVRRYKCPQPLIFRYYILNRRLSVQWRIFTSHRQQQPTYPTTSLIFSFTVLLLSSGIIVEMICSIICHKNVYTTLSAILLYDCCEFLWIGYVHYYMHFWTLNC